MCLLILAVIKVVWRRPPSPVGGGLSRCCLCWLSDFSPRRTDWRLQRLTPVCFCPDRDCYYFLCPFITSSHSFRWRQWQSHAQIQTCPVHKPPSVLQMCGVGPLQRRSVRMCGYGSKSNWSPCWLVDGDNSVLESRWGTLSECEFTYADVCVPTGWRCKRYGHRTGDKECPFFIKGNQKLEQFRVVSVWSAHPCLFRFEIIV